ncbi:MAG: cysteine synthase A [Pseudomonadota bacterium]|nr:cysteine synthase A [Pseudomonadota bacterium]
METNSVISQIGNTPLVRLKQASELTGCNIYGKAEYFNPGESVKDRAALFIVEDAIKRKLITKGGIIVEGTAGNTGIGLAVVCKEYGLKLKIVIPNTQSIEKKETLKKLGAELIEVDAVPYSDPKNYIKQSRQIAENLNKTSKNGVYWANQFDNIINTDAHIKTTAEEIWSQTAGSVDGFTCAVGTGGTLAGVSIGLKNKNKNIRIALSDPMGSSLFSHIKNNKLESSGSSITEGIGTARITKNFEKALVDDAFQTDDTEALNIVYDLIEKQKIVLGGSSGINIAGAIKLAQKMGPGKTIVTILCDHGKRYASKIFNKEFLRSKNLPVPKWL